MSSYRGLPSQASRRYRRPGRRKDQDTNPQQGTRRRPKSRPRRFPAPACRTRHEMVRHRRARRRRGRKSSLNLRYESLAGGIESTLLLTTAKVVCFRTLARPRRSGLSKPLHSEGRISTRPSRISHFLLDSTSHKLYYVNYKMRLNVAAVEALWITPPAALPLFCASVFFGFYCLAAAAEFF